MFQKIKDGGGIDQNCWTSCWRVLPYELFFIYLYIHIYIVFNTLNVIICPFISSYWCRHRMREVGSRCSRRPCGKIAYKPFRLSFIMLHHSISNENTLKKSKTPGLNLRPLLWSSKKNSFQQQSLVLSVLTHSGVIILPTQEIIHFEGNHGIHISQNYHRFVHQVWYFQGFVLF